MQKSSAKGVLPMVIQESKSLFSFVVTGALLTCSTLSVWAQGFAGNAVASDSPSGTWIGAAQLNSHDVPFRLEIAGNGDQVKAALINGKERSAASNGSYANGHLTLHFDYYANTLDATLEHGTLSGTFGGRGHSVPVTAALDGKLPAADANPPHLAAQWDVAVENGAKGEHTWKLRIRQVGPSVNAVIERIDGDTGNLYGIWRDGAFTVSHFTAAGPNFVVLRPQPDGTLQVETAAHGGAIQTFTAHRVSPVQTVALESTDDPLHHTYLKNPDEPLKFRFPDLNGKLVSSEDSEFAGKALMVSIGGSWCPNCQDEAPFLEELYRKYHSRGLEIVELGFEESSQLPDPVRLRAVIRRYGITYPVLLAGTPDQLSERFPHVKNLDCWPTTFFVGKDGLVKAIHTGYAGPATGGDNHALESGVTAQVERLLAGKATSPQSRAIQVAQKQ
jgi:thiol-disulfide isomerase/thioredoxin